MTKMVNKIAVGVAAALTMGLASAGVYAMPAAGEAPFADAITNIQTSQQGQFDWLAARSMPAAGEQEAIAAADNYSALTHAQVENKVIEAAHDKNGFPDASGERTL